MNIDTGVIRNYNESQLKAAQQAGERLIEVDPSLMTDKQKETLVVDFKDTESPLGKLRTEALKLQGEQESKADAVENQQATGRFSAEEEYKLWELGRLLARERAKKIYNTPFDGRKRNKKKARVKQSRKQSKLTKRRNRK